MSLQLILGRRAAQREVDIVASGALARWKGLARPTLIGQPSVLQNTGAKQ
jgi:hypothetical protein